MKMHNFTIRGNFLEIVGRIASNGAKNTVTVYDLEFPCGMENMSIEELRDVVKRLEADIDDLFYYDGIIKNDSISDFEDTWREGGEEDAHGA